MMQVLYMSGMAAGLNLGATAAQQAADSMKDIVEDHVANAKAGIHTAAKTINDEAKEFIEEFDEEFETPGVKAMNKGVKLMADDIFQHLGGAWKAQSAWNRKFVQQSKMTAKEAEAQIIETTKFLEEFSKPIQEAIEAGPEGIKQWIAENADKYVVSSTEDMKNQFLNLLPEDARAEAEKQLDGMTDMLFADQLNQVFDYLMDITDAGYAAQDLHLMMAAEEAKGISEDVHAKLAAALKVNEDLEAKFEAMVKEHEAAVKPQLIAMVDQGIAQAQEAKDVTKEKLLGMIKKTVEQGEDAALDLFSIIPQEITMMIPKEVLNLTEEDLKQLMDGNPSQEVVDHLQAGLDKVFGSLGIDKAMLDAPTILKRLSTMAQQMPMIQEAVTHVHRSLSKAAASSKPVEDNFGQMDDLHAAPIAVGGN